MKVWRVVISTSGHGLGWTLDKTIMCSHPAIEWHMVTRWSHSQRSNPRVDVGISLHINITQDKMLHYMSTLLEMRNKPCKLLSLFFSINKATLRQLSSSLYKSSLHKRGKNTFIKFMFRNIIMAKFYCSDKQWTTSQLQIENGVAQLCGNICH